MTHRAAAGIVGPEPAEGARDKGEGRHDRKRGRRRPGRHAEAGRRGDGRPGSLRYSGRQRGAACPRGRHGGGPDRQGGEPSRERRDPRPLPRGEGRRPHLLRDDRRRDHDLPGRHDRTRGLGSRGGPHDDRGGREPTPGRSRRQLVGIVSRADLVRAFLRSDSEIEEELRKDVLLRQLGIPEVLDITVTGGKAKIAGAVRTKIDADLVEAFAWRVPGVVSVDCSELTVESDDRERV